MGALRTEKRKEKEGKKKKDPNAPKKPAGGAYGVFMAEKRQDFMKACAGQPITAVSKMGGEAWKKLSDDQKKPYETKYAKKLEEYKKAVAEYKQNNPDAEEESGDEDEDDAEGEEEQTRPKKRAKKAGA